MVFYFPPAIGRRPRLPRIPVLVSRCWTADSSGRAATISSCACLLLIIVVGRAGYQSYVKVKWQWGLCSIAPLHISIGNSSSVFSSCSLFHPSLSLCSLALLVSSAQKHDTSPPSSYQLPSHIHNAPLKPLHHPRNGKSRHCPEHVRRSRPLVCDRLVDVQHPPRHWRDVGLTFLCSRLPNSHPTAGYSTFSTLPPMPPKPSTPPVTTTALPLTTSPRTTTPSTSPVIIPT